MWLISHLMGKGDLPVGSEDKTLLCFKTIRLINTSGIKEISALNKSVVTSHDKMPCSRPLGFAKI